MKKMRVLLAAFLVALVGVGLGCSTNDAIVLPQDAGASETGGPTFGASACGSCVKQACATAVSACGSSPECVTYFSCIEACGLGPDGNVDPTCAAACPKGASSTGIQDEQQLDACRATGAGASCAACGADTGAGNPIIHQTCPPGQDTKPCFLCEDNNCCNTYDACHADAECEALKNCVVPCPSSDGGVDACSQLCYAQHPAGVKHWAARLTCMMVHCSVECTTGTVDPCVACSVAQCPEPYADLHGTADGFLLWDCASACGTDKNCVQGCLAQYPAAKPAWDAFTTCVFAACSTKCGT